MTFLVNPEALYDLVVSLFLAFIFAVGSALFVLYALPAAFRWLALAVLLFRAHK